MTDDTVPLLDALLKRGGGDSVKELAAEVLGRLMAYDVQGQIGAACCKRNEERTTQRNGYRHRAFDTRLGTLDPKIPKLRKVDDLVQAMGMNGISKSRVSELCKGALMRA